MKAWVWEVPEQWWVAVNLDEKQFGSYLYGHHYKYVEVPMEAIVKILLIELARKKCLTYPYDYIADCVVRRPFMGGIEYEIYRDRNDES